MERLASCKLMQIWSSGYDKFNIGEAHSIGLSVANNHGLNAVSVAKQTILMMPGIARRAPKMHDRVIHGYWAGNDHGMSSYSLVGETLGIVGLGNIGRLVAKRAEALEMNIRFCDPAVSDNENSKWTKSTLEGLLSSSDYLSFHVHLQETTRGMINSANISRLARKPFMINVS